MHVAEWNYVFNSFVVLFLSLVKCDLFFEFLQALSNVHLILIYRMSNLDGIIVLSDKAEC